MVFSSIPVFVDPPNWHQQQQQQQPNLAQGNNGSDNTQLLPPLPPPVVGGNSNNLGSNSIRPGSMADRARLAKIPPPETALKCPRCESTNTKFCYFNNYSLSQPRHFCKTCRRYWTRGGALRNVPVGGGCRRNKKNKRSSRSKSPSSSSDHKQTLSGSTSAIIPSGGSGNIHHTHTHELIGQLPQPHNLPFMASLQNLNRYAVGNMDHMGFQIGGGNSSGIDQWRLQQQIPNFLNGFETTNSGGGSSYPFQNDNNQGIETASGFGGGDIVATNNNNSRVSSQIPSSVKMEESGAMNHLSRASLNNVSESNNQYYSWTDMSGLASSSATHLL